MKQYWPYILIILITALTFFKIFTRGEYPYPGDLLVSFNFPWYSGGWEGYDPWTTHKEFIAMDAIRQHLPWHKITFEEIRTNFNLTLWNPYIFSGSPQLANIQTFIFNPFNILFLTLPLFDAWTIFVIIQVPLTIYFTYLFTRSLGLSKLPSMLGGIAFIFSSYFLNWIEIGIVGHSILLLPLVLYAVQRISEKGETKYLVLLVASSSAVIFAGHIQTAIFILLTAFFYYAARIIYTKKGITKKTSLFFAIWIVLTFLITAIQTIPTLELYLNSPLTAPLAKRVFSINTMPFKNLAALFAPDLFGNPATNNFWSTMYGEATPNVGVLPFFFATLALIKVKRWEIKFFAILSVVFILYVTKSPLFILIDKFNIPLLTGTAAARSMFIFCFAMAILSAYGLEEYINNKKSRKAAYFLMAIFFVIYCLLFLATFVFPHFYKNSDLINNLATTKRNLILPFLIFISLPISITASNVLSKYMPGNVKRFWLLVIFSATIFGGIYQFNKGQPTSPKQYFFPKHPVYTWLQENGSINRFHGDLTSKTWSNIPSYFRLYSAEGYGVFRIERYAQLFTAQEKGNIPSYYERSTAEFSEVNTNNKKRLYNLLGVKYLLAKDDPARDASIRDDHKPEDNVKLIWQEGKFKIYERVEVLPRFWLTNDYSILTDDEQIITKIYDSTFDLKVLLLEEKPNLDVVPDSQIKEAKLDIYTPNKISFDINTPVNTLFFISDTYYPGWKAYVDNSETKIFRAQYAFRAVEIPAGSKKLEFKFEPLSFKIGSAFTTLGLVILTILIYLTTKRKYL